MSISTFFRRIVRTGLVSFWRNGVVSLASVLVMTVTLSIIASLVFLNAILNFSLKEIQDKVDINIYFYPTAAESDILELQNVIQERPEVAEARYISREEAIAQFKERRKDNFAIIQVVDELEENPLGAAITIKAHDSTQYAAIARFLQDDSALVKNSTNIIEKINYHDNEETIERLNNVIATVQGFGIFVTIFFIVISVMITFNTIRLAIYSSREEIEVMRLVGAENRYIKGPFVVAGVVYGILSALITMLVLYPATIWISKRTGEFFGDFSVFSYYVNNFVEILVILMVSAVLLGAISSGFAIRRYLKK